MSRSYPIGEDTWFHPPARSRSHTVSGTQDDQHAVPRDTLPPTTFADQRPSVAHSGRRASLLTSAFGSLLSPTTSRSATTEDSFSTGMTTPPSESVSAPTSAKVDIEHADELHDSVSAYTPLSRVWSLKARRSSWGPTPPASAEGGQGQGSVVAWINSQEKETPNEVSASAPTGNASSLFRRFSMGTQQTRPSAGFMSDKGMTPLSPRNGAGESAVSDVPMAAEEEKARLGRSMNRRSSSSARRLSPMSEKLLRGHYEF